MKSALSGQEGDPSSELTNGNSDRTGGDYTEPGAKDNSDVEPERVVEHASEPENRFSPPPNVKQKSKYHLRQRVSKPDRLLGTIFKAKGGGDVRKWTFQVNSGLS